MRGDLSIRIKSAGHHHQAGSREVVLINLEQGHLFRIEMLEYPDGAVGCMGSVLFKPLNGLGTIPPNKVAQRYYFSFPVGSHILRDEGESVVRSTVRQDHAVAIRDNTPRRRHVDESDSVVVRKPQIKGMVQNLEPPEVEEKHEKNKGEDCHDDDDPPLDTGQHITGFFRKWTHRSVPQAQFLFCPDPESCFETIQ